MVLFREGGALYRVPSGEQTLWGILLCRALATRLFLWGLGTFLFVTLLTSLPVWGAESEPPALQPASSAESPVASDSAPVIKDFHFTGNTTIPVSDLYALLAAYINQPYNLETLKKAVDSVSEEYRQRGLDIARAYLPEQDIEDGIIEITIFEGKLGEIHVTGNKNYSTDFIRRFLSAAILPDTVESSSDVGTTSAGVPTPAVTSTALERGLLILNTEFADLKVMAGLDQGKELGTVDVHAKVEDDSPFHATVSVNNFGSPTVSRWRLGVQMDWTNAILPGSHFNLGILVGEKTDDLANGNLSYTFPIDTLGTMVSVNGAFGKFDISGDLIALGIHGKSTSGGISISHPYIKSRTRNLTGSLGISSSDSKFIILENIANYDRIRTLFVGGQFDQVHWGGKSYANVTMTNGIGSFWGGMGENDPQVSRTGAGGAFTRLNLSYMRFQPMNESWSIMGRLSGQLADDSLVAGEEWQVGGPNSVRGFSPGQAAGDEGFNVGLEFLASPFANKAIAQFAAFVEQGAAYRKIPVAGQGKKHDLLGAGVGFRSMFDFYGDIDFRLDIGFPIDPNQNSLDEEPMLYVSASMRF
ncbi:MAG: ShlB/FhaC/HecB family hemolysin secretion/activation protein [Nitrospirota bacterium]